jgi:hypothetical protein
MLSEEEGLLAILLETHRVRIDAWEALRSHMRTVFDEDDVRQQLMEADKVSRENHKGALRALQDFHRRKKEKSRARGGRAGGFTSF